MHNWSLNIDQIDTSSDSFRKWRLEQLINFGLAGEKIKITELRQWIDQLVIDPHKKKFIDLLLHRA